MFIRKKWGGRRDSNPRPSEPQSDILTRLNYAHHINFSDELPPHTHALAGRSPPAERRAFGASAGIRTLDLRLRRPLLYPAELQAHSGVPVTHFNKDRRSCQLLFEESAKFFLLQLTLVKSFHHRRPDAITKIVKRTIPMTDAFKCIRIQILIISTLWVYSTYRIT